MITTSSPQHARLPGDRYAPVEIPGLISAYRFREGYPAESLEPGDVRAALALEDGWLWLHFSLTDKLARTFISGLTQLPEPARALLVAGDEPLSLDSAEDAVFGVFADFEKEFDRPSLDVGRFRFALTERLVISGRRHPLKSIEEVRQAVQGGLSVASAAALMETIFNQFCDAVARSTAEMRDELDRIEDHVVSDLVERERARLVPVRRTAVRLHRQLSSLHAIMRDWDNRHGEDSSAPLPIAAGRLAARLDSLDQDVLGVQDRSRLLQDEVAARLAEETNRSLKALSEMTALLLPGSLVASIFGMNVHGLPFVDTPGGFIVVMLVGIAATAGFYMLLRRGGAG